MLYAGEEAYKYVKLESWNSRALGWKGEIQINDRNGQTEKTERAVGSAHLVACSMLYRIPFMLKGILKSVGSLVDKLWTCFEYELFHPEQRCIQRRLIWIDSAHWSLCSFEYFYINGTHLDSVDQPLLIIIKTQVTNDYLSEMLPS